MKYFDRFLVVEDEEIIRRLLALSFERKNVLADIAKNGIEALEMIDRRCLEGISYKVILTDLRMPLLDGVGLIKEIGKRFEEGRVLRPDIYVLSACPENEEEFYSLRSSYLIRRVFRKPISPNKMIEEIINESYSI